MAEDDDIETEGSSDTGIYIAIGIMFVIVIALVIAVVAIKLNKPKRSDADPPRGSSGLSVYSDYKTGCQYIAVNGFGKLMPRLTRDGKHLCVEKKEDDEDEDE